MPKVKKKVGRPAGSNRKQTEQRLLISARKCFAAKGFDGTTFKDVAQYADMTPAALYQYFDSKMALYSATLDKTLELLLPQFFEAIEHKESLLQKIEAIFETAITFQDQDKVTTAFLITIPVELTRHPDLHDYLGFDSSGIVASIKKMLQEAKRNGELADDIDEEGFMLTLMGGIMGITLFQDGLRVGSAKAGIKTLLCLITHSLRQD
jgi:AcrR family transcriptional regulator